MKLIDLKKLAELTSLSVATHREHLTAGMPPILVHPDEYRRWLEETCKVNGPEPELSVVSG